MSNTQRQVILLFGFHDNLFTIQNTPNNQCSRENSVLISSTDSTTTTELYINIYIYTKTRRPA